MFATAIHFHPSLIFAGQTGAFQSGPNSTGRLLALPTNIRLVWKCMVVANILAYYATATIITVNSFIGHSDNTYDDFSYNDIT